MRLGGQSAEKTSLTFVLDWEKLREQHVESGRAPGRLCWVGPVSFVRGGREAGKRQVVCLARVEVRGDGFFPYPLM